MESGTTSDDRRSNDGVTASDRVVASKRTLTVSSIVIVKINIMALTVYPSRPKDAHCHSGWKGSDIHAKQSASSRSPRHQVCKCDGKVKMLI